MSTVKMRSDNEFNVAFCKLMKNYPALYDFTLSDYCNREIQDTQWQELGTKLDATAQDCKERWKNIRNRYVKFKNAHSTKAKATKEYYLAPHLGYLDKFLRRRTTIKSKHTEDCSESEVEETTNSQSPKPSPPPSPVEFKYRQSPSGSPTDVNKSTYECYFDSKQFGDVPKDQFDPDLAFLQSVLPDMKAMRADQKRKFKIGVINLAGQILNENPLDTYYNYE